ncbi:MAG TPA: response regulator transcription factor, partial [Nitriliruptoraceae bacterium]|nr:response regulator transcription factor [Nitriliruptoraceae bacterium]
MTAAPTPGDEPSPIRVCLVDDQTLVREGIRGLLALADQVEVVAEATDGIEGLAVIDAEDPDVVLLDLRMPRRDGLALLEDLAARDGPMPPVLVLTTFNDDELVLQALRSGARGYLLKDVTLDQLVGAIERLAGPASRRRSRRACWNGSAPRQPARSPSVRHPHSPLASWTCSAWSRPAFRTVMSPR